MRRTPELNVAVSAATLLNIPSIAVDVARLVQGRTTVDELLLEASYRVGIDRNPCVDMSSNPEPVPAGTTPEPLGIDRQAESSLPFQIAVDRLTRDVTAKAKFR